MTSGTPRCRPREGLRALLLLLAPRWPPCRRGGDAAGRAQDRRRARLRRSGLRPAARLGCRSVTRRTRSSVSPDGRRAAVTNYGTRERPGSTLSIVDLEQPRELRRIELAPHTRPHGVAWFAADRIAVTAEGSKHLLVVEPGRRPHRQRDRDGPGRFAHGRRECATPQRAYVTNIGSGTTTALDLAAGRKLGDLATGAGSEALALTPDGRELWVAARADGQLADRRHGNARGDGATAAARHPDPHRDHPRRPHRARDLRRLGRNRRVRRREPPRARPAQGGRAPGARGGAAAVRPARARQRPAGRPAGLRATAAAPTSLRRWATASCSTTPRRSSRCARSRSAASPMASPRHHVMPASRATPAPPTVTVTDCLIVVSGGAPLLATRRPGCALASAPRLCRR